ncbi:hypothetical protein FI667_g809, partial [Globisporangium splendens]
MCALFRSHSDKTVAETSPRGLRKLFRKLRSRNSSSDDESSEPVHVIRPRDTIVTPIDYDRESLACPRSRRSEQRRSGFRFSM